MKTTTANRLNEIMDTYNLRQVDILNRAKPYCEKLNVKLGRNDLSQYVSGKVSPGQDKLTILALALGVSETWLMGYDVPMERKLKSINFEEPDPNNEINFLLSKLQKGEALTTEEQKKITQHLENALPRFRDSVEKFGNALIEAHLKAHFDQLNTENKNKVVSYTKKLLSIQRMEEEPSDHQLPKAASERTDIEVTHEMRQHDDDIMNDPNF
ncbi:MAG: transcriptional regulator [Lachnospiraceae bacterium]